MQLDTSASSHLNDVLYSPQCRVTQAAQESSKRHSLRQCTRLIVTIVSKQLRLNHEDFVLAAPHTMLSRCQSLLLL